MDVSATSVSPSGELWDYRRSWPRPLPTWREMRPTSASRNYTEIGHTGKISKSSALVKATVAQEGVKGLQAHLFPKQIFFSLFEVTTLKRAQIPF